MRTLLIASKYTLVGALAAVGFVPLLADGVPSVIDSTAGDGIDLVPFIVEIPGGLADSAGPGTSVPQVLIDCTGHGKFVVTSVVLCAHAGTFGSFRAFSMNRMVIEGYPYYIVTENIVGTPQTAAPNCADLLGMPRRNGPFGTLPPGGNVPHEIIADAGGSPDIEFQMFASSSLTEDLNVPRIRVTGWKPRGETVSVDFIPGN